MNDLTGKVAIITGAAGGVGMATAKMFLEAGAQVVATDINYEKLQTNIESLGSENIVYMQHDVASEEDWQKVVDYAIEKFGHLEILVNNAGVVLGKNVETETLDEWNLVMNVSATGPFLGIKYCSKVMSTDGRSSIINVSSVAGLIGGVRSGDDAAYNSAKGAERLLSKHAAHTLASKRIRVNSIHPGGIMTEMAYEIGRKYPNRPYDLKQIAPLPPHMAKAEDVANLICFLASDDAAVITGAEIACDNGMTSY